MNIFRFFYNLFNRRKNPKLTIELVDNGAIIEIKDHADFNEGYSMKTVYKFDEEDKDGLLEMMWQIDEFAMLMEGKYSKERLEIKKVHGDNYICKDKDCKICKEN